MARHGRLCQFSPQLHPSKVLAGCRVLLLLGASCFFAYPAQSDEAATSSLKLIMNRTQFEPNTELKIEVRGLAITSRLNQLSLSIVKAANGTEVSKQVLEVEIDGSGNLKPVTFSEKTPNDVGVYEARVLLSSKQEPVWARIRKKADPSIRAAKTILVKPIVSDDQTKKCQQVKWVPVRTIQPSKRAEWTVPSLFPQGSPLLRPTRVLSSENRLREQLIHDKAVSVLAPGESFDAALTQMTTGNPYRISVTYPSSYPIDCQFSVASQSDPTHSIALHVKDNDDVKIRLPSDRSNWSKRSFIIYPNVDDVLTLRNLDKEQPAMIESIRIEKGTTDFVPMQIDGAVDSDRRLAVYQIRDGKHVDRFIRDRSLRLKQAESDDGNEELSEETLRLEAIWLAYHRAANYASMLGFYGISIPDSLDEKHNWIVNIFRESGLSCFLTTMLKIGDDAEEKGNIERRLMKVAKRVGNNPSITGLVVRLDIGSSPQDLQSAAEWTQRLADQMLAELGDKMLVVFDDNRLLAEDSRITHVNSKNLPEEQTMSMRLHGLSQLSQIKAVPQLASSKSNARSSGLAFGSDKKNQTISNDSDSTIHQFNLFSELSTILRLWAHRTDASILFVDSSLLGFLPHDFATFLSQFQSMPTIALKSIASPDPTSQTVVVKRGGIDGRVILAIYNTAFWPCRVAITTNESVSWHSSKLTRERLDDERTKHFHVDVGPSELVVLQSDQKLMASTQIDWASEVKNSQVTIEKIKADVATVAQSVGTLADSQVYEQLSNPGFESEVGVGISGWLHAQHPPGAVAVDDREAYEGSRSLCLTTQSGTASRTWLVSETVSPPKTGRLAVSMACRGELSEITNPHQLRISIEGTSSGQSLSYSRVVDVPRNGQWQSHPLIIEADGLVPNLTKSLRITVDSLSTGKVWIDGVRLHDHFATSRERNELQSLAFLAVQGIQHGNLAPSAKLLYNPWAQRLIQNGSSPELSESEKTQSTTPASSGVADRIRNWLPRPLRF